MEKSVGREEGVFGTCPRPAGEGEMLKKKKAPSLLGCGEERWLQGCHRWQPGCRPSSCVHRHCRYKILGWEERRIALLLLLLLLLLLPRKVRRGQR
jgi:hypothetical protein